MTMVEHKEQNIHDNGIRHLRTECILMHKGVIINYITTCSPPNPMFVACSFVVCGIAGTATGGGPLVCSLFIQVSPK